MGMIRGGGGIGKLKGRGIGGMGNGREGKIIGRIMGRKIVGMLGGWRGFRELGMI